MSTINLPPKVRPLLGAALATALMVGAMLMPDQSSTEEGNYPGCQEPGKQVTPREATQIVTNLGTYARTFAVPPEELNPQEVICTANSGDQTALHIEAPKQDFVDAAQDLSPGN